VNNALMFGKATDEWSTPQSLFDALNDEFGFDIDAAASAENAKCPKWLGPGRRHPYNDALKVAWSLHQELTGFRGAIWLNPPYSLCREFVSQAAQEARMGATVVCLVPSRTDTRWWHEHVWDAEKNQPRDGVEVRFIKGRLKFGDSTNSAPFPSVIIVFRPPSQAKTEAA